MEAYDREINTHRILLGKTRVILDGGRGFVILPVPMSVRLGASEYYGDILQEAHLMGLLTEVEALNILRKHHIWKPGDEQQHHLLAEKIEDLKVGLFENWTHSNNRFLIREALIKGKAEYTRLDNLKHCIDHVTCEGVAAAGKARYLTGFSLHQSDGTPLWIDERGLDQPDDVVDDVIEYLVRNRLGEADIRDICRNDPWRSYWSARKLAGRGFLDVQAVDLTDEQRYIMMWSNVYDTIRESQDCPDDSILDDDDMLDGWMIKQKRERDHQRAKKRGEEIQNEKIRNADEVYLMADTVADARRIDKMNDTVASTIKAQRLRHLRERGEVHEMEMPDTWARFQQQSSQAISERIRAR